MFNLQFNPLELGPVSLQQSYCCLCLFLKFNKGNSFAVAIPEECDIKDILGVFE